MTEHVRTVKLIGKVFPTSSESPARVTVNYNNITVFDNIVATTSWPFDIDTECDDTIATWETSASIGGIFPVSIQIENCQMLFRSLVMNYVRDFETVAIKDDAVWPGYVPRDVDEFGHHANTLTNEEFWSLYKCDKNVRNINFDIKTITPRANHFMIPGKISPGFDGRSDVTLNGVSVDRDNTASVWVYHITNNSRLEFNQHVVPEPPSYACVDGCVGLEGRYYLI